MLPFVITQVQHIRDNINRLLGRVKISDGTRDVAIDTYHSHLGTIDPVYRENLRGNYLLAHHVFGGVANGATVRMLIRPQATIAITFDASCTGTALARFREGVTYSAAGSVVTPRAMNRVSSITPTTQITHTPTITSYGTLLDVMDLQGAGMVHVSDTQENGRICWILQSGLNYLYEVQNVSGSTAAIIMRLKFSEF